MYFLDLLYVRYNCAKFHQCRICVTDFREGGPFCPSPHPWAAPKKPILNRVKSAFQTFEKNNPSLSKPTLKYLVYRQVFWVKVGHLQGQGAGLYGRWCFITSFQISCNTKKNLTSNAVVKTAFSQPMFHSKTYPFSKSKTKKEFYCRCYVLNVSYTFRFSFPPPPPFSMFLL